MGEDEIWDGVREVSKVRDMGLMGDCMGLAFEEALETDRGFGNGVVIWDSQSWHQWRSRRENLTLRSGNCTC